MGFKTNIPLEPDSICDLVLFNGNLSVESHICTCQQVERKMPKYRVGARFTKVSAQLLEEVLEMEKLFKSMKSRISTKLRKSSPQVAVFKFPEKLSAKDNEDMMKAAQDQLDESILHFVADFGKVTEIDDGFITQLLEIDEEIRFEGGVFIMAASSSKLLSKKHVSDLATTIPIFETVNKAVSSIKTHQVLAKE